MTNEATRLAEAREKIAKAIRKAEGQGCQDWKSTVAMRDALAAIDALATLAQPAVSEEAERAAFKTWWSTSGFTKYKDTGYACWLARAQLAAMASQEKPHD